MAKLPGCLAAPNQPPQTPALELTLAPSDQVPGTIGPLKVCASIAVAGHEGFDQGFGTRRTTGDVHIHRQKKRSITV